MRFPVLSCLSLALCGVNACAFPAPTRGTEVSAGSGSHVARTTFETRANHTDRLEVAVFFPSDGEGRAVGLAHPGLVFVQGGAVERERYAWQAVLLAQAGYVVALPDHPLALAIFRGENGQAARVLLQNPPPGSVLAEAVDPRRVGVGGHSLGGVVAVKLALEGGFAALVLEASYPDGADEGALSKLTLPSLSVGGTKDCSAALAQVKSGWAKLPAPSALVEVDGLTHYQWTNSEEEDVARGCATGLRLEEAHARIGALLTTFLARALSSTPGVDAAALGAVPGVTVETR